MVARAGRACERRRRADLPHLARASARARAHGGRLLVEAPPQACGWVRDRFGRSSRPAPRPSSARTSYSSSYAEPRASGDLRHRTQSSDGRGTATARGQPSIARRTSHAACTQQPTASSLRGPLANPKLTFDQFVIGDCNRLAHAAALTVAEMPAQAYNPLFICGPPGVGKTHLLSSIASLLLAHNRG